jgi:hypothetical protein
MTKSTNESINQVIKESIDFFFHILGYCFKRCVSISIYSCDLGPNEKSEVFLC